MISEEVLSHHVLCKVVLHVAPDRVYVICAVLSVVELDYEVASVYPIVVRFAYINGPCPSPMDSTEAFFS